MRLRASQQLAVEKVRWLMYWRLLLGELRLMPIQQQQQKSSSRKSRRGRWSRRCRTSLLGSKERGDRPRLHWCGRISCRRSGGAGGGIMLSLHVHDNGDLHTVCFLAHKGCVLCVTPRQMLYHPADSRRGLVPVCGVTSGGLFSCVTLTLTLTRVIIIYLLV